jgi:hypothetical protein
VDHSGYYSDRAHICGLACCAVRNEHTNEQPLASIAGVVRAMAALPGGAVSALHRCDVVRDLLGISKPFLCMVFNVGVV